MNPDGLAMVGSGEASMDSDVTGIVARALFFHRPRIGSVNIRRRGERTLALPIEPRRSISMDISPSDIARGRRAMIAVGLSDGYK